MGASSRSTLPSFYARWDGNLASLGKMVGVPSLSGFADALSRTINAESVVVESATRRV